MEEKDTEIPKISIGRALLLGDSEVGKSCLMLRYTNDSFSTKFIPTIGVDFRVKKVSLPNKEEIKLQIWDTGGQERFRNITTSYIRGTQVICIVYDVTNMRSFQNLRQHIKGEIENPEKIKFIVGNKNDMEEERQVTFDEGKKMAEELGYEFREVSAASGQGVDDLFLSITKAIYRKNNPGQSIGWSSSATSFFKK